MAGATVGLADTFLAASTQPAGFAMTIEHGDDNFASNTVQDGHVQDFANSFGTSSIGVALENYPWGVSIGYVTPSAEGQPYSLPSAPGDPANLSVTSREFRIAGGSVFFGDKLALGLSLNIGKLNEEIVYSHTTPLAASTSAYQVGGTLGAMYQLPHRWLLGLSYTFPTQFGVPSNSGATPALPGFFEPIRTPWRLGIGVGYIPNRFLRADADALLIGKTDSTALLSDQSVPVGERVTAQPRIGAAYIFSDYKEFRATFFGGTYFENTRIAGTSSREHLTLSIETKPWILTVGSGLDIATDYRDIIVSVSVDVFKVMAKIDLIPTAYQPDHEGWFPNPFRLSGDGLPRTLVKDYKPQGPDINPIKVAEELPKKVQNKVKALANKL